MRRPNPLWLILLLILIALSCRLLPTSRPQPQPGPDADRDWVSDADEEKYGTDPDLVDTDGDGATDFEEIFIIGSEPTVAEEDSDGDFIRDITETKLLNSDPDVADEDRDFDGIPDLVELEKGSDPGKMDSDGDLLSDFLELFLTETDPAHADPINEFGYPVPLEPWLPQHLQGEQCEINVGASIDRLLVVDPEEADFPANDYVPGDEAIITYGLWLNSPADDTLFYLDSCNNNPAQCRDWERSVFVGEYAGFAPLSPVKASCGDTVSLAIMAWESDAPFGGYRSFGTYVDTVPIIFNRLPLSAEFGSRGMYFEGIEGDSDYYRYEIDYSFLLP